MLILFFPLTPFLSAILITLGNPKQVLEIHIEGYKMKAIFFP
jgi:hypothetical protein